MGRQDRQQPSHGRSAADRSSTVRVTSPLAFLQALWALDHQLQSVSKRMERALGITGPQRLALRMVAENPGIAAGPLARALHLHPSTLTGILRRLVQQRLLIRMGDPVDGRRALFLITSKGSALLQTRSATVESSVKRLLERTSAGEQRIFREVLERLSQILTSVAR